MNNLIICENVGLMRSLLIIKNLISIIQIIVPLIIILFSFITFFKGTITGNKESLLSDISILLKKIIAALIIFLVPSIINYTFTLVGQTNNEFISCMNIVSEEKIKETEKMIKHNKALIKDVKKAVDKFKGSLTREDYNQALKAINELMDSQDKTDLNNELTKLEKTISINEKITSLENNYSEEEYKNIVKEINKVKDNNVKNLLLSKINKINKANNPSTSKVVATPGITTNTFTSSTGKTIKYGLIVPDNVKKNMPLIIYLHGDGNHGTGSITTGGIMTYVNAVYGNNIPFIVLQPLSPICVDGICTWIDHNVPNTLNELITQTINDNGIDKNKVILTGFSRGGVGVWYNANKYPELFSAIVPVSGSYSITAENFKNLPVRAFSSQDSSDSWNYSKQQNTVNAINNIGGNASFYGMKGYSHGSISKAAYTKETFEWMLNQ